MAVVLLDRRWNTIGLAAEERGELTMLVDGHTLREVLAFADPHFEAAVDDQVVDLCHQPAMFDAQVVDDHPVGAVPVMHLHLVGCFPFAANSRLYAAKLLLNTLFRGGVGCGMVEEILKDGFLMLLVVSGLNEHRLHSEQRCFEFR